MRVLAAILLLTAAGAAHAQLVSCSDAVAGQPYAACTHLGSSMTAPPAGLELFCGGGAVGGASTLGTTLASCVSTQWLADSSMQTYSWVWTLQGWQRHGSLSFPSSPPNPPGTPTVTGDALVSWTPPLLNADGSALTDLSGYKIYFGVDSAALSQSTSVAASASSYQFNGLTPGTWYFAVSSLSAKGGEGIQSNVASKAIDDTGSPPPQVCPSVPSALARTQSCPAGTIGSYQQMQGYLAAPYPTCWTPSGSWLPASAPAGACATPPPVWRVAPNGTSATRPVYEAVLPVSGSALVRGNQEGAIATGKPCGAEVFNTGSSYRSIADADAKLASPTYVGRQHVAVCVAAP